MRYLLIALMLASYHMVSAQWNSDPTLNTLFYTSSETKELLGSVSDGNNGIIFVFSEGADRILVKKVTSGGAVVWGTTSTAVVATSGGEFFEVAVAPDGTGGILLAWSDYRHNPDFGEVYVQRINSSGVPVWTANGLRLTTTGFTDEFDAFIVSDGAGGAIVGWNLDNYINEIGCRVQRLNSTGVVQWTPGGVTPISASGFRIIGGMIADGSNGVLLSILDSRNDPFGTIYDSLTSDSEVRNIDLFGQRLNGTGTRQWTDAGVPICTFARNQLNSGTIISDGAGGAFIAFEDYRNDPHTSGGVPTFVNVDIFAQRINASGARLWNVDGVPITTASGNQFAQTLFSPDVNQFGCSFLIEASGTPTSVKVYAQLLNNSGTQLWTANGLLVSGSTENAFEHKTIADGQGNTIVAFVFFDGITFLSSIRAQKINAAGALQWGTNGAAIGTNENSGPFLVEMTPSDNGSAIIAWNDFRTQIFFSEIYGSKINSSGTLVGSSGGTVVSIANGNWNNPATWQGNVVPGASSNVVVRHQVLVTANTSCLRLRVEQPGGDIRVNPGINLVVNQ